jgi:hypothetical protein
LRQGASRAFFSLLVCDDCSLVRLSGERSGKTAGDARPFGWLKPSLKRVQSARSQ